MTRHLETLLYLQKSADPIDQLGYHQTYSFQSQEMIPPKPQMMNIIPGLIKCSHEHLKVQIFGGGVAA